MQYRPHRYQTDFPVSIRTPAGPQKGTIADVNSQGARIRGLQDVQQGDKLQIDILSHHANAVVRWTAAGQIGVIFRPHLTEQQVDTLRYRRDLRHGAGRGSVGFGLREMR